MSAEARHAERDGDAVRVWDGTQAARNSIIGNYVPYIWLGAEERGLCVFGENDRGWVTDPKTPCQELVRRGDVLELRLNLVAQRTTFAQPRRIVIGFQATPTKPLPANWRLWAESYATKLPPGGKRITFNGSCWTWGALTPCLDVYPRDADLTLWDEFAKTKRTGVVNQEYFERWLAGYPNKTEDERKLNRNNINYGFHILKSQPTDVLVYTNARGVRFDTPEGQTFLDEWHRDPFTTRTWAKGDGVAYDLNPGESFRDYAVWYYQRMLATFADHIYWDDIFLQSCFDVIGSEAYELPDGNIQPAAGLFDMRELDSPHGGDDARAGPARPRQPSPHDEHRPRPDPGVCGHAPDLGGPQRRSGFPGPFLPRLHPRRKHRPPAWQCPVRPAADPRTGPAEGRLGAAARVPA